MNGLQHWYSSVFLNTENLHKLKRQLWVEFKYEYLYAEGLTTASRDLNWFPATVMRHFLELDALVFARGVLVPTRTYAILLDWTSSSLACVLFSSASARRCSRSWAPFVHAAASWVVSWMSGGCWMLVSMCVWAQVGVSPESAPIA